MKLIYKISAFTTLLFLISIVSCVQYGTDVLDINQYPFYIMIGNPHICGGTLLSYDPPLVLTAAHCVADADRKPSDYPKNKNPYFVNYYHAHRDKQKSIAIANWTIHPLYNVSATVNMNYDVAIVQLETPLRKSTRVKRVPLWSPSMTSSLPTRGELVGFGYTGLNQPEAKVLQRLQLDITRFDPNGFYNVEAKSDTEEHIACHGDSGSPLIVYHTVNNPVTHKNITVPFVLGNLARIFGAHDLNPKTLTCPIPHEVNSHSFNSSQNTVTESFCNVANMLDWISQVTGISKENLSDPFYMPPHPPCINCKKKTVAEDKSSQNVLENNYTNTTYDTDMNFGDGDEEDDDQDEAMEAENERKKNQHPDWHIGVAVDENGLLGGDQPTIWIGGLSQDFLQAGPDSGSSSSSTLIPSSFTNSFVLLIFTLFTSFIIIIK